MNYHTGVVAAALATAQELGVPGQNALADKAFRYLLRQQREDGSVPHSQGDYGVLSDRRAYPRYLAMMVFHLVSQSHRGRVAAVKNSVDGETSHFGCEGSV